PDPGLQRVVAGEDRGGLTRPTVIGERRGMRKVDRLAVAAHAEVEEERRAPLVRLRHRAGCGRALAARLEQGDTHRSGDGKAGGDRDYRKDTRAVAHSQA